MKLNGYIKVCSESGKVLADVENAVTELWESVVAASGIDNLFCGMSAIEAGQSFICGPVFVDNQYLNYYYNSDYLFTVYLLYLSEAEKKALNKSSNLLPIYNSSFEVDNDKVVGFATATYQATKAKEGYLQPITGENLMNVKRHALKFKWDVNVLSGSYNTIAIGLNVFTNPYNGITVYRGLEANNTLLGETAAGGYLLRPGVKTTDGSLVITKDNEILLGDGTTVNKGRKVLNLTTGEITLLNIDDPRYDFPLFEGICPQLVINDNLVYSNFSRLYRVDIRTKTSKEITSNGYDAFIYNGYLYSKFGSGTTYRAYSLDTFAYTASAELDASAFNLPDVFLESKTYYDRFISNIGDNYLIVYRFGNYQTNTTNTNSDMKAFICSDLGNAKGSIIEIIPNLNTLSGYIIDGKKVFFNHIIPFMYFNSAYYRNMSGSSSSTVNKRGLKMTTEGLYGNLISFKTFDEDQTIPTDEGINLTYYYTFEQ